MACGLLKCILIESLHRKKNLPEHITDDRIITNILTFIGLIHLFFNSFLPFKD